MLAYASIKLTFSLKGGGQGWLAYFFFATAALKPAPGVNFGTVVAAIFSASPVRGFLPLRAAHLTALKVPKPIRVTSGLLATA